MGEELSYIPPNERDLLTLRLCDKKEKASDSRKPDTNGERQMRLTLIGNTFAGRDGKGTHDIAYEAKMPSGAVGKIIRIYEFHDRDTLSDEYYATPNIAEEVRAFLTECDDRMDTWEDCFSWPGEDATNGTEHALAKQESTELIARW